MLALGIRALGMRALGMLALGTIDVGHHQRGFRMFRSGFESRALLLGALLAVCSAAVFAAPTITRLTPPSNPLRDGAEVLSRFLPGQRFDLQATVHAAADGSEVREVLFTLTEQATGKPVLQERVTAAAAGVQGARVGWRTSASAIDAATPAKQPLVAPDVAVASVRGVSLAKPGRYLLSAIATDGSGTHSQPDVQGMANGAGVLEVVAVQALGPRTRNVIIFLGDGMGAAHRTAARILAKGYAQGKAQAALAMDTFPVTGMVMTSSLNSIVTDSAPGMSNYVTGNKAQNNQEGVFPDDTLDAFDNPRVEYLAEYLHRTRGTSLGIVTTADVFDATPAANAVHSSDRGLGTGIVDQFFDDRALTGLRVVMGGGRKWFLPRDGDVVNGSARRSDPRFADHDDLRNGWTTRIGGSKVMPTLRSPDPKRNLLAEMQQAGWTYAPDRTALQAKVPDAPDRSASQATTPDALLGLFAFSNMNVAFDKINGRRCRAGDPAIPAFAGGCVAGAGGRVQVDGQTSVPATVPTVVEDYGFPDQPMLDEMTDKALQVLDRHNRNGFVLMVEGASIDKQSHQMDSDRWMLEVLEFDRAVARGKAYAAAHPDTLVIVTADHECSGAALIGAATTSVATLRANATAMPGAAQPAAQAQKAVGVYEAAGFPHYRIAPDGFPVDTDIDGKMLIGYGANADRYEAWLSNQRPNQDGQQPFVKQAPLSTYPVHPTVRNGPDDAGNFTGYRGYFIAGQVPGDQAVHTAVDVPLSAFGRGASLFAGYQDNTDVFFRMAQAVLGGTRAGAR